jgi:hypothetical protein
MRQKEETKGVGKGKRDERRYSGKSGKDGQK